MVHHTAGGSAARMGQEAGWHYRSQRAVARHQVFGDHLAMNCFAATYDCTTCSMRATSGAVCARTIGDAANTNAASTTLRFMRVPPNLKSARSLPFLGNPMCR